MRCFIAIDLPDEVKQELARLQAAIGNDLAKIRWVKKENLHLTLKFLGELNDAQIEEVKRKLTQLKLKPLEASLTELGVFPSPAYIRVLWAGMEPAELVKEIHSKIDQLLGKEEKRFESHITIGRVASVRDKAALIEKLKEIKVGQIKFPVNSLKLKKSTLTRAGPIYEDIASFELAGG